MKHLSLLSILLFIPVKGFSQNLIPNPDFEIFISCPATQGQLSQAMHWQSPTITTPDYYNECSSGNTGIPQNRFGYQHAKSGSGYSGMYIFITTPVNWREYVEVKLNSPLIAHTCYHFQMYVSLADSSSYTTDNFGVYFSDSLIKISNINMLNLTPQISNNPGNYFNTAGWTPVSGIYEAAGGEEYLTIGNFVNDVSTNKVFIDSLDFKRHIYVYVDDVSLTALPSCVLPVELINFSASTDGNNVKLFWTTASETNNDYFVIERSRDTEDFRQLSVINGNGNSTILREYAYQDLHPLEGNSYYRLKQIDYDGNFSYSKVITLYFTRNEEPISIVPNPASDNAWIHFSKKHDGDTYLEIVDLKGKIVFCKSESEIPNPYQLNIENIEKGIYFLQVYNSGKKIKQKLVIL